MPRLSLIIMFCLTAACQHRAMPPSMDQIPLPDSSQLLCCWQAQESLDISFQGKQSQLSAVVAVERQEEHKKLTLVMFNPLGQRMLTVTQQGNVITTTTSTDLKESLPVHFLLAGLHLTHTAESAWPIKHSDWSINTTHINSVGLEADSLRKELLYKGHQVISLITAPENSTERTLYFADHEAVIKITTLARSSL